jgi:4-amino-4-deoxy-L-arabinose transferase-like glycosyltransferase
LSQGADGQPPVFYLIERSTALHILNEHIGYRLLPALGFLCTLILLDVFVKTQNGAAPALVSASLLLMTPLFTIYAAEARPYSPLTACLAIALVCYQRTPAASWVGGLFLSLLFASSLHYYAVFALFPFLLAELTVVYETRKVRFWVWLALLAALVPLGICWPLLMQAKQHFGAFFLAPVSLRTLPAVYAWYLGVAPAWGMALVGAAVVAVLATFFPLTSQPTDPKGLPVASAADRVLVLGLTVLPMIGFIATRFTHAPFLDRYFSASNLGDRRSHRLCAQAG